MTRLGVNIDHVATIREARKIDFPDPVQAGMIVELAGAYGVTVHLRKDRRHIKERDVELLKKVIKIHLNVEISLDKEIIRFVKKVKPDACCLVPERREEITTEGGLDIIKFKSQVIEVIQELKDCGIKATVFIEPEKRFVETIQEINCNAVEINTSKYSESKFPNPTELKRIKEFAKEVNSIGVEVHAGHGLNWYNVKEIAKIEEIVELNIGHSIVGRAVFIGLERAIKEILEIIEC